MTGRGFTGHEHLDGFGLIHMNARLYDPILGRFLSPDPYVQLPDFTQAMNRYGYCMNRPLCYVDKNGEVIGWIIAGAIIGGAINVATHWDNISNFGQFLGYFGVGAAAGALGPLVGGAVGGAGFIGGAISGMVGGAASGFTLGTGNTLMAGGGFLNALGNGTMGAFSGAMCGGALGGVFGGGIAIAKGQNFWHGNAIAQGRGMFSWKNTPVGETGALSSVPEVMPDAMPKNSEPTSTAGQAQRLTPYQKGKEGVDRAIAEFEADGGIVYQTEVTVDLYGVRNRFDFVGKKGEYLYLFEVKNGPTARMTPNQKINIPIMQNQTSPFIPIGNNAKNVPAFNNLVGGKYTDKYIVIYRRYY